MNDDQLLHGPNPGLGRRVSYLPFEKPIERIAQDMTLLELEHKDSGRDLSLEIKRQSTRLAVRMKRLYSKLTAWETVLVARHPQRPRITDYLGLFVEDFCELHGDRVFGDDRAMVTGFARIG
ncbi:MAG: hypothetical protein IID39_09350, partial [Planctomycetes bacterium]|nr:hypothetical protein [Planctomycetota bacterium]